MGGSAYDDDRGAPPARVLLRLAVVPADPPVLCLRLGSATVPLTGPGAGSVGSRLQDLAAATRDEDVAVEPSEGGGLVARRAADGSPLEQGELLASAGRRLADDLVAASAQLWHLVQAGFASPDAATRRTAARLADVLDGLAVAPPYVPGQTATPLDATAHRERVLHRLGQLDVVLVLDADAQRVSSAR